MEIDDEVKIMDATHLYEEIVSVIQAMERKLEARFDTFEARFDTLEAELRKTNEKLDVVAAQVSEFTLTKK